jgi:nucleotide-binding universal stress UspA family protein
MKTIKQILVPIDFSENSMAAFQYALDLVEKLNKKAAENAEIKVIHVDDLPVIKMPLGIIYSDNTLEASMEKFVEENIIDEQDTEGVVIRRKVNIETEVIYGTPASKIIEIAETEDYDLIVMGMVGKRTLGEIMMGSVATDVAQNAHCPVLLVPQGKHFKPIKNLAYACDFDNKSFKHPALVADVAKLFNAHVHLVFVKTLDKTRQNYATDLADMQDVFEVEAPSLKFNGYIVEEDDVFYGINNFSHEHKIDLLVTITKTRNFWNRLFHASVTKELAMYSELPLLIIKEMD